MDIVPVRPKLAPITSKFMLAPWSSGIDPGFRHSVVSVAEKTVCASPLARISENTPSTQSGE